jgi:hypothetical protein
VERPGVRPGCVVHVERRVTTQRYL